MAKVENSPFSVAAAQSPVVDSDEEPVHEDVSDGLTFSRRCQSWFCPTYTRRDCRCGFCSIGDPDPCPYARPGSDGVMGSMGSMLTAGRRSLSRLMSLREVQKDA